MDTASALAWRQANQRYLATAVSGVRAALERHAAREAGSPLANALDVSGALAEIAAEMAAPPALEHVASVFGLSAFERDILLLCAAVELDASVAALCATAQGDSSSPYPTFSLALAALADAHWTALTPSAPLRHWRLIEPGNGSTLTTRPLHIDESILHLLIGVPQLDARLATLIDHAAPATALTPTYARAAERVAHVLARSQGEQRPPLSHLLSEDMTSAEAIVAAACALQGMTLYTLVADTAPTDQGELALLARLWMRHARLEASVLLIEWDEFAQGEATREAALAYLIERVQSPLALANRQRRIRARRRTQTIEVRAPAPEEQRALWADALGEAAGAVNGEVGRLVSQFHLTPLAIQSVASEAFAGVSAGEAPPNHALGAVLWETSRAHARPQMDDLAQRIDPGATWDDLVLPEAQTSILREIASHVRQRAVVYEEWGFGARGGRGLGISALFGGASGTGKTLAAEVLAHELQLDLYRIDLSSVVSKYIGETEKNLRRIFDAAEIGGAILLFDEADALFGKRSEVKDSHDRYANIEVSYLLQRMEVYRGLAVLTTNLKHALDTAFLRRIRFAVQFPFPDASQRAQIWRRVFPSQTPTDGLAPEVLARLNVAGGNIRNIALNAAFLAADAGAPVRMEHVLKAARTEYAKLEKPLTDAEIGGWLAAPAQERGALRE